MVARGDLGVEVPFEKLPSIQKKLINICRKKGKISITATEMLESMIHNARPTRAEISDVANAVYDGTGAVMLSGETAAGKYPVETVQTMARIVEQTEQNINYSKRYWTHTLTTDTDSIEDPIARTTNAVSHATCAMAIDLNAKAIIASTLSGNTARMVSRFRPPVDIVGLTTSKRTWYAMALNWGVMPVLYDEVPSSEVLFYEATRIAKNKLNLQSGDQIIITAGPTNKAGATNLLKVSDI